MAYPTTLASFSVFFPPYREIVPIEHPRDIPRSSRPHRGAALVWGMHPKEWKNELPAVRMRPPGVALVLILPPADALQGLDDLLLLIEGCRPQSVVPFLPDPQPEELVAVLRRPPYEPEIEITEYLRWRGLRLDVNAAQLIRRTIELSADLRTVTGLARALYLSRRALGRRFLSKGLPVASHWLHFGRIMRSVFLLQSTQRSLFSIACELGYPDGFSLSNQMKRLTGIRPTDARRCLGWEWIVESWLLTEIEQGGFSPDLRRRLLATGVTADADAAPSGIVR